MLAPRHIDRLDALVRAIAGTSAAIWEEGTARRRLRALRDDLLVLLNFVEILLATPPRGISAPSKKTDA
jgi:hypothetical protein